MIRHLLTIATFMLLNFTVVHAQVEKTFFQTFNVKDGVRRIFLKSNDVFELKPWNGVQLMVETTIRLEGGSMDLLGLLIKDERYNFSYEENPEGISFHSKLSSRPNVKRLGQVCTEKLKVYIYVPEEFNIVNNTELVRKELIVAKGGKF